MSQDIVTLDMPEMTMVTLIAGLRRGESKANNRADNHGFNGDGAWDVEIEGCAAEMAYSKYRGVYWSGSVCSFKGADSGSNVQIRHTEIQKGSLIVRECDNDDHYYVLVVGKAPVMRVVGYIQGRFAKDKRFLKAPNGRDPAYFVPQSELKKIPPGKRN